MDSYYLLVLASRRDPESYCYGASIDVMRVIYEYLRMDKYRTFYQMAIKNRLENQIFPDSNLMKHMNNSKIILGLSQVNIQSLYENIWVDSLCRVIKFNKICSMSCTSPLVQRPAHIYNCSTCGIIVNPLRVSDHRNVSFEYKCKCNEINRHTLEKSWGLGKCDHCGHRYSYSYELDIKTIDCGECGGSCDKIEAAPG